MRSVKRPWVKRAGIMNSLSLKGSRELGGERANHAAWRYMLRPQVRTRRQRVAIAVECLH